LASGVYVYQGATQLTRMLFGRPLDGKVARELVQGGLGHRVGRARMTETEPATEPTLTMLALSPDALRRGCAPGTFPTRT
jgi:hypothetical protein